MVGWFSVSVDFVEHGQGKAFAPLDFVADDLASGITFFQDLDGVKEFHQASVFESRVDFDRKHDSVLLFILDCSSLPLSNYTMVSVVCQTESQNIF